MYILNYTPLLLFPSFLWWPSHTHLDLRLECLSIPITRNMIILIGYSIQQSQKQQAYWCIHVCIPTTCEHSLQPCGWLDTGWTATPTRHLLTWECGIHHLRNKTSVYSELSSIQAIQYLHLSPTPPHYKSLGWNTLVILRYVRSQLSKQQKYFLGLQFGIMLCC